MFKFRRKNDIQLLKDWQLNLINNENVDRESLLKGKNFKDMSTWKESELKHELSKHTKFNYDETCDFWINQVFEGFYYVDIPNADYYSHYLIEVHGDYYIFENKCGRANYAVYLIEKTGVIEYDEKNDSYKCNYTSNLWEDDIKFLFSIRLKDIKFTHEFLENFLSRRVTFKKGYERHLKLNQLL